MPTTQPANGRYNAARFAAARKALAQAMSAPVFTADERTRAEQNALACDSLFRLALWLKNVTRVAAERAVAAAKAHTAAAAATAKAPAFEYRAFRLKQARLFLMQVMGNSVFSAAERLRANDSAYQCDELRRLTLWLRNAKRVVEEREAELWAAHETGANAFLVNLNR